MLYLKDNTTNNTIHLIRMAAINDLISQIENPELRSRIQAELDRMNKQKKFGLVFEEHLPESVKLYDVPVKKNSVVMEKAGGKAVYKVLSINDGIAECIDTTSQEPKTFNIAELVSIAQFGTPIYPYLKPIDSICNAPDSDLWHTLIEADNYHALQLLEYLYAGKVDCIYIDPPYNTGARDWKYNNDYVDGADEYRHSKWLSFMQRRLALAKKLLNPKDSVLIVTIDEKEYLHLGCLLEQMFPEAQMQMVTIVINPFGQERNQQLARVEEYAFFLFFGHAAACSLSDDFLNERGLSQNEVLGEATSEVATPTEKIRWERLLRGGADALRKNNPNLFYPVFVNVEKHSIQSVGLPIAVDVDRNTISAPQGCVAVWPIKTNGVEGRWRCSHEYLKELISNGYARVGEYDRANDRYSLLYLSKATMKRIEDGEIEVLGRDSQGSLILGKAPEKQQSFSVKTVWNRNLHRSGEFGTRYIRTLLPGRTFPYPKSLYAVRDTLKVVVNNKPNALILDFFAGSGTTLHAVNLLNSEDGGNRRCIMVTNNEVADSEAKTLLKAGYAPGDKEWENLGIARYINWPRTVCSIRGKDTDGNPLKGYYMGSDIPLSSGFKANAIFFKLGFLNKNSVALGRQFRELLPVLWMKAGAIGKCPELKSDNLPDWLIFPENKMAVLIDDNPYLAFKEEIEKNPGIETLYIITDFEREYAIMANELGIPNTFQLYRDYLDNFRINHSR